MSASQVIQWGSITLGAPNTGTTSINERASVKNAKFNLFIFNLPPNLSNKKESCLYFYFPQKHKL
jgi:hypothetical protein